MTFESEGTHAAAIAASHDELRDLIQCRMGEPLTVANELPKVDVRRVDTRNRSRLPIRSTESGQWIRLDELDIEALTWQNTRTLEAVVGSIHEPLLPDPKEGR